MGGQEEKRKEGISGRKRNTKEKEGCREERETLRRKRNIGEKNREYKGERRILGEWGISGRNRDIGEKGEHQGKK